MLAQGRPPRDLHQTDVAGLKHGHRAVRGVRFGGDITGISIKPGTNVKLCKKMLRSHDRGIFFFAQLISELTSFRAGIVLKTYDILFGESCKMVISILLAHMCKRSQ